MNVIAKISCNLERSACRYTENAQRIFKDSDIQYTSLTAGKIPNSLIYRTLFYVNTYGSYKLSKKQSGFWPTLYINLYSPIKLDSNTPHVTSVGGYM